MTTTPGATNKNPNAKPTGPAAPRPGLLPTAPAPAPSAPVASAGATATAVATVAATVPATVPPAAAKPAPGTPATSAAGNVEEIVNKAVREISHIATLPEITVKIIELVEDPTSTAQDLHKVIANDPALCSRVLKVVNSSFYGLPGQIGSINRAIVMLGLNAVKNIAISASLAKLFRGGQLCPNFAAKDLWTHSISVGVTAKMIADELGMAIADEAFLAGLMHDIGIMVELQSDKNKLIEVLTRTKVGPDGVPAGNMIEIERAVFGADHQQFGRGLCERWKFPKAFATVCGHHHNPTELPSGGRSLAGIIYIADRAAASIKGGLRLDLPHTDLDSNVMDEVGISNEQYERIKAGLPERLKDVESLLA
ncbi:MAG: HDOD domain-containing protein [Phycisphaerales bacterium]